MSDLCQCTLNTRSLAKFIDNNEDKHSNSPKDKESQNVLCATLDWKEKALHILQILFNDAKSIAFRCAVDEKRDKAPNYYKMIQHPMDLSTLKSLITSNTISCAKQYVTHLVLIWDNALTYNAANLAIYADAQKLKSLSNKLIRQYWPNQNLYEAKRKSRRIRKNAINKIAIVRYSNDTSHRTRQCLHCGECNAELHFMCGFHVQCRSFTVCIACSECNRRIRDTDISYYHCVAGCQSTNEEHSLFICEYCAEQRFDSKQCKINGHRMAFRGLFLDLSVIKRDNTAALHFWFEAIIMKQDANRVFYELVFSSETHKRWVTEAQISERNSFEVVKTRKGTDFTRGVLSDDGLSLTFIDKEDPENSDPNRFKKVEIKCRKCGAQCMFMGHCMLPCNDARSQNIFCDTHHLYYNQEKSKHPTQRCASFKSISDEFNHSIYGGKFYFSCAQCNDFDQCEICTLIQYERAFKKEMETSDRGGMQEISEPPRKRQRMMTTEYDNLYQVYIEEKRKNQQLKNENGVIKNELEIALLQNEKQQQELEILQSQKDEYCKKLNQLKEFLIEFD